MSFRITGLDPTPFVPLYGLSDEALKQRNVVRMTADAHPGYPDRVEMRDVSPGETVLLLNFEHLPVSSPYRSQHAIFVREGATVAFDEVDEIPEVFRPRILSVRAFDSDGMMLEADLVDGETAGDLFERMLSNPSVEFLHVHNAKPGCFAGKVTRT